jgi:hypothetical protein
MRRAGSDAKLTHLRAKEDEMSSYDQDREIDGAVSERLRIGKLLARKSYVAGDGVRMYTTKLDAMLKLIGLSDDEVAKLVRSVK